MVYCAGSAALAVLEVRVHLDLPFDLLPDDYVLMRITAPDDLTTWKVEPEDLPKGWQRREDLSRPIGDTWLEEAPTALLSVLSAIVEVEPNRLFNPRHHDAVAAAIDDIVPFGWDERPFR